MKSLNNDFRKFDFESFNSHKGKLDEISNKMSDKLT